MNVVPIPVDENRTKWQTGLKQATFILGMWFLLMFAALLIIFPFEFSTCQPPEKIAIATWCFQYSNTSLLLRYDCPSFHGLVEFPNGLNETIYECWYVKECKEPSTIFLSKPIYVQQELDYKNCLYKNVNNKSILESLGGIILTILGLFFISLFTWLGLKYKKPISLDN